MSPYVGTALLHSAKVEFVFWFSAYDSLRALHGSQAKASIVYNWIEVLGSSPASEWLCTHSAVELTAALGPQHLSALDDGKL